MSSIEEIDSPAYRQGHAEGFEGTKTEMPDGEKEEYRHGHEDGDASFHMGPPLNPLLPDDV